MTAERESMTLQEMGAPALGVEERRDEVSLPFIPSVAETLEFCITTGYPFRHA